MHQLAGGLLLGYHGCDRSVGERLLAGEPFGVFLEGDPIYENSGFYEKAHLQIAVRNPDCIKGVFRVPKDQYD